jgi:F0F1-type ATP synthase delta subunit
MKYSTQDYAKALVEAIEDPALKNKGAIEKNFLDLVRKNGDEARLTNILAEAARIARGKGGARDVFIQSARSLSKAQEKLVHQFVRPGDVVEYDTDADLIAGIKITVNDEMQFDGTMKSKLDKLFGN